MNRRPIAPGRTAMSAGTIIILAALLGLLVGCKADPPTTPAAPAETPEKTAENAAETDASDKAETTDESLQALTMQGIDLYMHRRDHQEGVADKPEMWVHADSFAIEGDQAYRFEKARAVIYGREEREEITIEAQSGSFKQDTGAVLNGDVRMVAGTLHLLLSDIEWVRAEEGESTGMAFTDNPVVIDDPDLQLNAANLRIYPDTQYYELTQVSGVIRFGFGKDLL